MTFNMDQNILSKNFRYLSINTCFTVIFTLDYLCFSFGFIERWEAFCNKAKRVGLHGKKFNMYNLEL